MRVPAETQQVRYLKRRLAESRATPVFAVVRDEGWRETVIASGMYESDADLVCRALRLDVAVTSAVAYVHETKDGERQQRVKMQTKEGVGDYTNVGHLLQSLKSSAVS